MPSEFGTLTYAIGDVHGCLTKLNRLLDRCRRLAGDNAIRFVFVGDYTDRGPDSRGVVTLLMHMQRESPHEVICLRGNHDAMVLAAANEGPDIEAWWLENGGGTTLASYGVMQARDLPAEHLQWLGKLPFCHDDGRRYFVHAGVAPGVALELQSDHDRLWIREPFLSCDDAFGRLIVHGHTPLMTAKPDVRENRINIDTGAVYGGPLTAAAFNDAQTEPIGFLTDS
jgi:serine/threonine protein phosphatase 1